jgi:hypothetical protein
MSDSDGRRPNAVDVVERPVDSVEGLVGRVKQSDVVQWVLLRGPRRLVTLALLGGVFVTFLGLALIRPWNVERLLSDTATLRTLFQVLLSGAILIVSVVSSISSIVLSQEISDIETEQERIDASIEFRRHAEDLAGTEGSPGQPAAFLKVILHTIYEQARELGEVAAQSDDREFSDQIEAFAEEVVSEAKEAATTLDGARFGTFTVLSAGLNYDYSWQINTCRRIQNRYDDRLEAEEREALSNLLDTLKFFATGREYFQSLYYKREVARLSSTLLYVSLPVIVLISYLLLALDANFFPSGSIGLLSVPSIFILFAYTVSLAPYVVLTAYVVRIAAITMRTLAAGPFIIRQRSHGDIVEVGTDTDPSQWNTDIEADSGTDSRYGGDERDRERGDRRSGDDERTPAGE